MTGDLAILWFTVFRLNLSSIDMESLMSRWQHFVDALTDSFHSTSGKNVVVVTSAVTVWPIQEWNHYVGFAVGIATFIWIVVQLATHVRDKWLREQWQRDYKNRVITPEEIKQGEDHGG